MSGNPPLTIRGSRAPAGFTLVELLVVISLLLLVMTLVIPALNGMKGAGDVTKAAYDITGALDQARAYAMANNTYVYVGIGEFSSEQASSSQLQVSGTGIGRVLIATVASSDGTRGYDPQNLTTSGSSPSGTTWSASSKLGTVGTLQHIDNMHLASGLNGPNVVLPTTGGLARPLISDTTYVISTPGPSTQPTSFNWPPSGAARYTFNSVINFSPQGVARIQTTSSSDLIPAYIEIGLQQTHGTVVSSGSNVAIVQVDGVSGQTRIYRP